MDVVNSTHLLSEGLLDLPGLFVVDEAGPLACGPDSASDNGALPPISSGFEGNLNSRRIDLGNVGQPVAVQAEAVGAKGVCLDHIRSVVDEGLVNGLDLQGREGR